jgi:hypothetical protein
MIYTPEYERSGFVYFLHDEQNGLCKIGYTTDMDKRLKGIQRNYPVHLSPYHYAVVNMSECESYLHRRFHLRRSHGEWFRSVSFIEFKAALDEYLVQKKNQKRDRIGFLKFLSDTDFERESGMPKRIAKLINENAGDYSIAVFVQDKTLSERGMLDKFNSITPHWFVEQRDHLETSWFKKHKTVTTFSVYESYEYPTGNFSWPEVRIQTSCCDKRTTLNFLYGLNTGLHFNQK